MLTASMRVNKHQSGRRQPRKVQLYTLTAFFMTNCIFLFFKILNFCCTFGMNTCFKFLCQMNLKKTQILKKIIVSEFKNTFLFFLNVDGWCHCRRATSTIAFLPVDCSLHFSSRPLLSTIILGIKQIPFPNWTSKMSLRYQQVLYKNMRISCNKLKSENPCRILGGFSWVTAYLSVCPF